MFLEVLNELIVALLVELMLRMARQLHYSLAKAHLICAKGAICDVRASDLVVDSVRQPVAHRLRSLVIVAVFLLAAHRGLPLHEVERAVELELLAAAGVVREVVVDAELVLDEVVGPHLVLQLDTVRVRMLLLPLTDAASEAGEEDPDHEVEHGPDQLLQREQQDVDVEARLAAGRTQLIQVVLLPLVLLHAHVRCRHASQSREDSPFDDCHAGSLIAVVAAAVAEDAVAGEAVKAVETEEPACHVFHLDEEPQIHQQVVVQDCN